MLKKLGTRTSSRKSMKRKALFMEAVAILTLSLKGCKLSTINNVFSTQQADISVLYYLLQQLYKVFPTWWYMLQNYRIYNVLYKYHSVVS